MFLTQFCPSGLVEFSLGCWNQKYRRNIEAVWSGVEKGSSTDEAEKYLKDNQMTSALPKIIKTAFSAVHLIYYFTAGPGMAGPGRGP